MNRAVIYARESSDDTNKSPPIEEQIERAKQHISENELQLVGIFQDNGYSGGDWKRPNWNKLVKEARFHKFNIVLVWNTDRIARDTEQFLWFNRNLKESYVKVYSLTEGEINLDSVGDTAKNISIAMANEIFRKVTSEKVRRAYEMRKRKAKDNKVEWGRKSGNYDLEKIRQLRSQGLGFREIAKQVKSCSYQTIRRLLQNTHEENNKNIKENSAVNP